LNADLGRERRHKTVQSFHSSLPSLTAVESRGGYE
jgi:hypothetical protein